MQITIRMTKDELSLAVDAVDRHMNYGYGDDGIKDEGFFGQLTKATMKQLEVLHRACPNGKAIMLQLTVEQFGIMNHAILTWYSPFNRFDDEKIMALEQRFRALPPIAL
jgi:hypothetical protein